MNLCEKCQRGAHGDDGHDALRFYVGGPFPGQSIFNCSACGDRWIRHHSQTEKYGWTRYFLQFAEQHRRPLATDMKPAARQ
jgi:hypothetical protein